MVRVKVRVRGVFMLWLGLELWLVLGGTVPGVLLFLVRIRVRVMVVTVRVW